MKPAVRGFLTVITMLGILLMITASGWAGPRDHDGGFFLRLSGGGGYASGSLTITPGPNVDFSGTAGDVNFAIGGMVARNLAVHGTIWGWLIPNPDWKLVDTTAAGTDDISLRAMGGGATYYFMPVNIYISSSIGIGALANASGDTDPRLAIDVTVGKEWWIGDKWGLGLAGAFGYFSVPAASGLDASWSGTSFALRLTATLNGSGKSAETVDKNRRGIP
jgi:hypothetical protein